MSYANILSSTEFTRKHLVATGGNVPGYKWAVQWERDVSGFLELRVSKRRGIKVMQSLI